MKCTLHNGKDDENRVRDIKIAKSAFQVATKGMQYQHNEDDDDAFSRLYGIVFGIYFPSNLVFLFLMLFCVFAFIYDNSYGENGVLA